MDEPYLDPDADRPENDQLKKLVGFLIGEERFGVDILMVREIIRQATVTPIPNAPDFIEGVINLRGSIIPVIDLRKRLKLVQPTQLTSDYWILILTVEGRVTGFMVDRVIRVLNVPHEGIQPPPDIVVAGLKSQYIQGVCKLDQRLLILLDFNRILMVDEIKTLKSMRRSRLPATS